MSIYTNVTFLHRGIGSPSVTLAVHFSITMHMKGVCQPKATEQNSVNGFEILKLLTSCASLQLLAAV
jgi:hypothetical protein